MIIYILTLFLLGIFLVVGIGAGISYEMTWWRYERMIRACDKKLQSLEKTVD